MKILHLSSGNLFGGVESMLLCFAKHQSSYPDLESHYGLCFEGSLSQALQELHSPLHLLGAVQLRRLWSIWRARSQLSKILNKTHFDAVICHMGWTHVVFGPEIRKSRIPLVLWLHQPLKHFHWIEKWASFTAPDLIICNSSFTKFSVPAYFPRVPVCIISCPVTPPIYLMTAEDKRALRIESKTSDSAVVITQVSRMQSLKGHKLHLKALSELKHLPHWKCWMIGGPQRPAESIYFESLRNLTLELGIEDRVHFWGHRKDVAHLLQASQIYCQPNEEPEAFGISFIEAHLAGLPVITTEFGGALEIVTPETGILFAPHNVDALKSALEKLIMNPTLREKMGSAGIQRAHEISDPAQQMAKLKNSLKAHFTSGTF